MYLQNSCFHKIPAVLIENTIGSSHETLTTANTTLTVFLDCDPDLKSKTFRAKIFNLGCMSSHLWS